MIQLVDYSLTLSNGERVSITEFDPARIPYMSAPEVLSAVRGLLERCTFAPREALESAKRGWDKDLLKLLRSPEGGMARAGPPVCRLIKECAMAVPAECTLRSGAGRFPICWEYDPGPGLAPVVRVAAVELGTAVGNAWRAGSHPVVVDLDRSALR